MDKRAWTLIDGGGPVLGLALHAGHRVRKSLRGYFALNSSARRQEEDPYTGVWAQLVPRSVVVNHSRFEVDLNRPRDKCVYRRPEDAWGLEVWNQQLSEHLVAESLERYDRFYQQMESLLTDMVACHHHVAVLDIHSYNHRRRGPDGPPADPEENPAINLGTGTMDRSRWDWLVEAALEAIRTFPHSPQPFDVRENVKFFGGHFATWCHQNFPESVCVLSLEFKKFFMDEWTGKLYPEHDQHIRQLISHLVDCLTSAVGGRGE